MPSPSYFFIQAHQKEVDAIVDRLNRLGAVPQPAPKDGLAQFSVMWNASVRDSSVKDPNRHRILTNTYRWLQARAQTQEHYREQVGAFLARCLRSEQFQRTTLAREPDEARIKRVGLVLTGIGNEIERVMPNDTLRAGKGSVHLRWQDRKDAQFHWDGTPGSGLSLFEAAVHSFSTYGKLPGQEVSLFAALAIADVADALLPLPNFAYSRCKPGELPEGLVWQIKQVEPDKTTVPEWIVQRNLAPVEPVPRALLELVQADPELAERLDRILCEATMTDVAQESKRSKEEETIDVPDEPGAVEQLIEVIAQRTGRSIREVSEFFGETLFQRQSQTRAASECAAKTAAIVSLLSKLNAP
jgi:hypothetical protein